MNTEEMFNALVCSAQTTLGRIKEIGGVRNQGTEGLFRWLINLNLLKFFDGESIYPEYPHLSPFFFDVSIMKNGKPIIVFETKVTNCQNLFTGKEAVNHDFDKLVKLLNHLEELPELVGLIYNIENYDDPKHDIAEYVPEDFMGKRASLTLWDANQALLKNRYFEIIVGQKKDGSIDLIAKIHQ